MIEIFEYHYICMAEQLADSSLERTRKYWRNKLGFDKEIVDSPLNLSQAIKEFK